MGDQPVEINKSSSYRTRDSGVIQAMLEKTERSKIRSEESAHGGGKSKAVCGANVAGNSYM